ncbi:hypothetical protein [Herbaspirillum sp. alder98]|uniref:hypothetical protein n=1 Tax=Herbaspirillum sp. alder98 TaxID=2913096 RepID=UPI001CD8C978|nr:hypothetical protein [Herbaspirillum sp. alder98]MCA1325863.1 hypothetical protein [Herbaspirillum sp. alder98]
MNGTWSWPLLLALSTGLGLAAGIFGDGPWDWFCWAGLGLPVVVAGYKLLGGRRPPG